MPHISSYKELRVYQNAMAAAMRIFELTKRFPIEEGIHLLIRFDDHRVQCALTSAKRGVNVGIEHISLAS